MKKHLIALILVLFTASVLPPLSAAENLRVKKVTMMPGWPTACKQIKIVLISDLHLTTGNISKPPFTQLPAKINALKPDLLLIGGDIFDAIMRDGLNFIEKDFLALIAKINRPPLGILAICGNHDIYVGRKNVEALLLAAGITIPPSGTVLPMTAGGKKIYIGTTEAENAKDVEEQLKKAMTTYSPFLLLAHYPQTFEAVPQDQHIIVLAGHTHGGVVRLPGVKDGALASLFTGHQEKYFYGFYQENHKVMYVTSGIGGEGKAGMRVNNPPEIVLLNFQ